MHDSYLIPNKKKTESSRLHGKLMGKNNFSTGKTSLKEQLVKNSNFTIPIRTNRQQSSYFLIKFIYSLIGDYLCVCFYLVLFLFFFFCQIARNILFEISHPVQRNSFQVEVGLNSNKQVLNERRKLVFKEGNEIQNVNKKLIFCPIFFF